MPRKYTLSRSGRRWSGRWIEAHLRSFVGEAYSEWVAATLLRPLGSVLFVPLAWFGGLLWLIIAQDISRVLAALVALLIAGALYRTLSRQDTDVVGRYLGANALLAGLLVAWLLPPDSTSIFRLIALVGVSALVAAALTATIAHLLDQHVTPPLVWGYCIVATILIVVFPEMTVAAVARFDWGSGPGGVLEWIILFLSSLGAFLFAPDAWSGGLIVLGIALWSRLAFLCGAIGWIAGTLTAIFLSSLGAEFLWQPVTYNFFLAGMSLGAIFFLPSWPGLLVAAAAGSIAAFLAIGLQNLLQFSPTAYLPAPFLATLWIGLLALRQDGRGSLRTNTEHAMSPEHALWRAKITTERWGPDRTLLMVPLYGVAEVTQGFDGRLSHIGDWRHALDFQRAAQPGNAKRLSIFGDAALAPAPGEVSAIENNIPDNPEGMSNFADNWGNYVIIKLDQGGWAVLAHLQQGTIAVVPGTRVTYGTFLGQIGNSGRSPVPHLHLQVQNAPMLGARTLPFRLANYLHADNPGQVLLNWRASGLPSEGTCLAAAVPNPDAHRLLAATVPGAALWSVTVVGEVPSIWRPAKGAVSQHVELALDSAGRQVFTSRNGGHMVARYDLDGWRIVDCSDWMPNLLRLLALAIPSIPYCLTKGLTWHDTSPSMPPSCIGLLDNFAKFGLAPRTLSVRSTCLVNCNEIDGDIVIETIPEKTGAEVPQRLTSKVSPARGPSSVVAEFDRGTVSWSLDSFEVHTAKPIDFQHPGEVGRI